MKPDTKGRKKSGKKRPITDGVVGLKSNGDVSAAGSSGSLTNGSAKKKKREKGGSEEIPVLEDCDFDLDSDDGVEPGSIETADEAMEWMIKPTSLQARISIQHTSRRSLCTLNVHRILTTKMCFLPKLWRKQYENNGFYMGNTWI